MSSSKDDISFSIRIGHDFNANCRCRSSGESVMRIRRCGLLHLAIGAIVLHSFSVVATAQTYPIKPVRIVNGFAAGGTADIMARLVSQPLSERLGQQIILENRTGAASNIATESIVRAPPDGYTLVLVTPANAINATLYEKLNYKFIDDIAPVGSIARMPNVMEVNPSVPVKTVPEFIAYAKANPGKINMASGGAGSTPHVFGELFKAMTAIHMVHVPYRGAGPALTDLLGGQVQVMFDLYHPRLIISGRAGCGGSPSPPLRAPTLCRTCRRWQNSCQAMKRAFGAVSVPRGIPRPKLSNASTKRSTRPSPIQERRHASRISMQ
jgi:hypothetical protein